MRRLGTHGPEVTAVGFGAWEAGGDAWGPNRSDDGVIDAMRSGIDAGMNWIDTAEVYGNGVSESLVGRAVVGRGEDVHVFTKVAPAPEGTGFEPAQVHKACDASLERMSLERIDLYQLHWPDPAVPVEDTWGAMAELVDAGKVRWIGVSNFDRGLIERCETVRHVDSLQQEFSMIRLDDRDLIRWCGEAGTGVLTYSPLGAGLLSGAIDRQKAASIDDWRRHEGLTTGDFLDRALRVVERMRPIADRLGCTVAQLALAWNWHQPGVTAAIAGSRDPAHVRDNARAGDLRLEDDTLAELERLLAS